ncbi:TetR/AcrR family transcriptional regulator, partial [Amycolatopsis sp. NPDC059090]|uniref:TetR/AcrR family transcriptional regulator n=1 Tax=Amycolatopsis sp. NPDC059090 TaxID=3346723 RepID=UPI00366E4CFF
MPKIVDHRQRRAEIADAVLAIVAEDGVAAVTLREVADRSGWSTGVLNHYVGGRDDLLRLAFRHTFWLSGRRLAAIAEDTELEPGGGGGPDRAPPQPPRPAGGGGGPLTQLLK